MSDKIKKRIADLLKKTEQNGATIAEATAAIEKAHELAKKYAIDMKTVQSEGDKYGVEYIVFAWQKSIYPYEYFLGAFASLFDVEAFSIQDSNGHKVKAFGEKQDLKMFEFFCIFCKNACEKNLKNFEKTTYFEATVELSSVRNVKKSYVLGFISAVISKVEDLILLKKADINNKTVYGIVLVEKSKKVRDFVNSEYGIDTIKKMEKEAQKSNARKKQKQKSDMADPVSNLVAGIGYRDGEKVDIQTPIEASEPQSKSEPKGHNYTQQTLF